MESRERFIKQYGFSMIENIKSYWNNAPCNIRHSNKKLCTLEYFNEVEKRKYFVEPHIPEFAEFNKWKGKNVLEIGCGIGTDSINFARAGANLTVVELSDKSLNICKSRFDVFGMKANFIQGNSENLRDLLKEARVNQKFDLIYAFGVIHHTESPEKIVEHVSELLNDDGEFRLMVYAKYSFKLFDFMYQSDSVDFSRMDEVIQYYAEAQLNCPRALTYTLDQAKELLKDFEITSMKKDHIFKYDIPNYIEKKYVVRDEFKNMTEEQFQEMCDEVGWHMLIKCRRVNK